MILFGSYVAASPTRVLDYRDRGAAVVNAAVWVFCNVTLRSVRFPERRLIGLRLFGGARRGHHNYAGRVTGN